VRFVCERGPAVKAVNQGNPELAKHKGNVGFCPRVFRVSFSCFRGFSLVLEPRGRLGGKVGSACEELEDSEGGILG